MSARKASTMTMLGLAAGLTASVSHAEEMLPPVYVESHDVILLDVSDSMNLSELKAAFDGVSFYYRSPEAEEVYSMGQCTANTLVLYALNHITTQPYILCSKKDVDHFVSNTFDRLDIGGIRKLIGKGTNVAGALRGVKDLFDDEKTVLNIKASSHRVVLVGDQLGQARYAARKHSLALSYQYGATVHAFAVGDASLSDIFSEYVVTPARLEREVKQRNGRIQKNKVAAGISTYAQSEGEITERLKTLLALGGY